MATIIFTCARMDRSKEAKLVQHGSTGVAILYHHGKQCYKTVSHEIDRLMDMCFHWVKQ